MEVAFLSAKTGFAEAYRWDEHNTVLKGECIA